MKNSLQFGTWAEDYAARYLESKGYEILDKNYRKPWGEIDLVAIKKGIMVFVEVKANRNKVVGFEAENRVSLSKLKKINRAIETYLVYKKLRFEQERQIDVISLTFNRDKSIINIRHFKNVEL